MDSHILYQLTTNALLHHRLQHLVGIDWTTTLPAPKCQQPQQHASLLVHNTSNDWWPIETKLWALHFYVYYRVGFSKILYDCIWNNIITVIMNDIIRLQILEYHLYCSSFEMEFDEFYAGDRRARNLYKKLASNFWCKFLVQEHQVEHVLFRATETCTRKILLQVAMTVWQTCKFLVPVSLALVIEEDKLYSMADNYCI